jgi:mono/diheme cytochrome c family protein
MSKIILCIVVLFYSCSNSPVDDKRIISEMEKRFYPGKGIGPVKEVKLEPTLDNGIAAAGEKIFNAKCTSCHKTGEEKRIGPGLGGVTKRRTPEWIMNQILNPLEMTKHDSLSKELLAIYLSQMTPMDLTEQDARAVLEYLRKNDGL